MIASYSAGTGPSISTRRFGQAYLDNRVPHAQVLVVSPRSHLFTVSAIVALDTLGAVFEWVRLSFGHLAGAITAVMYWISNPVWLGGTLAVTAIAAMDRFWGQPFGGIASIGWLEFVVGALF